MVIFDSEGFLNYYRKIYKYSSILICILARGMEMADKGSNRGNGNHVSVDSTTRVIIQEQNRDLFNEILKSYIRNKPLGPYEMGIVESFGNIIIGEEYKDIALLNGRYTNFENLLTKQVPTEIGEAIEIPTKKRIKFHPSNSLKKMVNEK